MNLCFAERLSQDTLSSLFPIASLSKHYYSGLVTSDVYGTPVSTTLSTAVTIVFSNTVRAERSEGRHRMTPIGVLRQDHRAAVATTNLEVSGLAVVVGSEAVRAEVVGSDVVRAEVVGEIEGWFGGIKAFRLILVLEPDTRSGVHDSMS